MGSEFDPLGGYRATDGTVRASAYSEKAKNGRPVLNIYIGPIIQAQMGLQRGDLVVVGVSRVQPRKIEIAKAARRETIKPTFKVLPVGKSRVVKVQLRSERLRPDGTHRPEACVFAQRHGTLQVTLPKWILSRNALDQLAGEPAFRGRGPA